MPKLTYQDFEIKIDHLSDHSSQRATAAYPVEARSADGEAAGEFVLPFSAAQLSDLEEAGPWLG
jgi:hypothetical protein